MENQNYLNMINAKLQNNESWITLFLKDGEKITGIVINYDDTKVLIQEDEYDDGGDVLVIPMDVIKYFSCGLSYFINQ